MFEFVESMPIIRSAYRKIYVRTSYMQINWILSIQGWVYKTLIKKRRQFADKIFNYCLNQVHKAITGPNIDSEIVITKSILDTIWCILYTPHTIEARLDTWDPNKNDPKWMRLFRHRITIFAKSKYRKIVVFVIATIDRSLNRTRNDDMWLS